MRGEGILLLCIFISVVLYGFDFLASTMRDTRRKQKLLASTPCKRQVSSDVEYVFIDLETTGLNKDQCDEILQIAIVGRSGDILLNTYVKPLRKLNWPDAQKIHGISYKDVMTAPKLVSLLPSIHEICHDKIVVFYHAAFDTTFFPSNFFPHVKCAMLGYAEASIDNRWLAIEEAAMESGYSPAGRYHNALEDARACRHIWLVGIPALEQQYPKIQENNIVAYYTPENGQSVLVIFHETFIQQLRFVAKRDFLKLWTRDYQDEINIYRPKTVGGKGKVATILKSENTFITCPCESLIMWRKDTDGNTIYFEIAPYTVFYRLFPAALKYSFTSYVPANEFDLIDNDIYMSHIVYWKSICKDIGCYDVFQSVEQELISLFAANGGKYYKTKRDAVKFIIIFDPYMQSKRVVAKLHQQGYKVTTFQNVIEYFGLQQLWRCAEYESMVGEIKNWWSVFGEDE